MTQKHKIFYNNYYMHILGAYSGSSWQPIFSSAIHSHSNIFVVNFAINGNKKMFRVGYIRNVERANFIEKVSVRKIYNNQEKMISLKMPYFYSEKYKLYNTDEIFYIPVKILIIPNYTYKFYNSASDIVILDKFDWAYRYYFLNFLFDTNQEWLLIKYVNRIMNDMRLKKYHRIQSDYSSAYMIKSSGVIFSDKGILFYYVYSKSYKINYNSSSASDPVSDFLDNVLKIRIHINANDYDIKFLAEPDEMVKDLVKFYIRAAGNFITSASMKFYDSDFLYLYVLGFAKLLKNINEIALLHSMKPQGTNPFEQSSFNIGKTKGKAISLEDISPVFFLYDSYTDEIIKCFGIGVRVAKLKVKHEVFVDQIIIIYFTGEIDILHSILINMDKHKYRILMKYIYNLIKEKIYHLTVYDSLASSFLAYFCIVIEIPKNK